MIYPGIIGTGFYVPKNKMDNARLSKINKVPTNEIYEKTGIKERRIADKNESASDMGFKASIKAIKSSNVKRKQRKRKTVKFSEYFQINCEPRFVTRTVFSARIIIFTWR